MLHGSDRLPLQLVERAARGALQRARQLGGDPGGGGVVREQVGQLRAERERQAKKDKARKQIVVGVSVVGVLAIAGGVSYGVMQLNKPSAWEAAADAKNVTAPKNTSGDDSTTVVIGESSAKKTLELYEDSRSPICATFEQAVGETVSKDVDAGKYKIKYVGATFIDNTDNGEGSKNALSALGAVLDVSPEAFLDYKAALYSSKYHPQESEDKFAKDDYLDEEAFWAQIETAHERAAENARRIRAGDVQHDPKGDGCPSWCDLWPICRVARA